MFSSMLRSFRSLFASLLVLLLLLPRLQAADLYHLHHLSEPELLQTYTNLLRDACHHADAAWKTSSFSPAAGYWGDGISGGNEGIRAIGEMVLVCGTLLKYSDAFSPAEREVYLNKATAALRYAVATHVTGTEKCADAKTWGNSWQSAMWTGTLAFGAWLIWDQLDTDLRTGVERVVASEADRFLVGHPPTEVWEDTKAEENGWNLICIALARNMFPTHPHAATWQTKALEYMMNTLSAPQDQQDKRPVDGRAVCDWFRGENVQPDFTLENHGIFHPCYVACSSYFLTQTAMYYTYAGHPVPAAASHHLLDTWHMLQTMVLPCGESAFPQGMDWELHGLNFINLYASLGTWQKDALAARMEEVTLQYMRAYQTLRQGDLTVPGSRLGFTRHAICAEQAAYGFLAHKLFGPPTKAMSVHKAAVQVQGLYDYGYVDFLTHRTADKFVSFSWKNRVMGLFIPIGAGHEANPLFTVPIVNGFVGSFDLEPRGNTKASVLDHTRRKTPTGFQTSGVLSLNGGRLKQTLTVTSIGAKTFVYQDQVTALTNVTVLHERGVPLGIENDELTGGHRTVYNQGGQQLFDWQTRRQSTAIPGTWANVDGRLSLIMVEGSGLAYAQSGGYDPHTAVCADVLYGSFSDGPKRFKAGETVARRIVLVFAETSSKDTAVLARSARVEDQSGHRVLRCKLPEGGHAVVPLQ
jgi:hypothetical protein